MGTISIHSPRSPSTKGSNTIAAATVPNVCKMPGPPAPFVPTPLPNIARSSMSPKGFSKKVTFDGDPVAIKGCSFASMGDVASKGTGGGLISNNVEGAAKFIAPGSMTVFVEGGNVHLLGDVMSNNNGPSGSPPNAATMMGAVHAPVVVANPAAVVACAIHCCDKKAYNLPNNRGGRQTCQRLAHRKHSCVLHKLRVKTNGRLTQTNKYKDIQASPRFDVPGIPRTLIPDTIVKGTVIDAKFPCDPSKVTFGSNVKNPSRPGVSGSSMLGTKELDEYPLIPGVKDVEGMTPSDAAALKGDCVC